MPDHDDEPTGPTLPDEPVPTLDPERLAAWASEMFSRNRRTILLAMGVATLLAAAALFWSVNRPSGPGVPRALIAEGKACGPPKCGRLKLWIDLNWQPPKGEVTVYRLYRDGEFVAEIGSLSIDYKDTDVAIGEIHSYELQAVGSEREGGRSYPAKGQVPEPQVVSAQLSGDYDVVLTVKVAKRFPGRHRLGDRYTVRWGFEPRCRPSAGACATVATGLRTTLRFTGSGYSGEIIINGVRLRAGKGRLRGMVRLTPTDAALDGMTWRVTSFTGTETVVSERGKGRLRMTLAGTAR